MTHEIHVVCLVLVDADGYFYATQRPRDKQMAFHWEFPGGKIEQDETPEDALRREIKEELSWCVSDLKRLPDSVHVYKFGTIRLTPFLHRCIVRPNFFLTEHIDSRWIHASDWDGYTWAPADVPIVEQLLKEVVSNE